MTSVRDFVRAIQKELRDAELTPDRASELLNQATSLLGNCTDETRHAHQDYSHILLHALKTNEKANRAKIEAETSAQFLRWQEAKDTLKLTEQMIITLRQFLRTKESEMRLGGR
jgi:hypothetical protein